MSKLLEGLNPSQREAVTHETGPLLIIAGPGSGKTRTVVHSIAYAIENGVMPEQILAFSFTVKASEELRDRVKEIVGEEKGDLVNISTFHSFRRQVLREDIDKLSRGYTRNFRTLEENDQRKIVKNLARINEQRVRAEIEHIQSYKFPNPDEVLNFIKKNAYCQQALDHEKSERYDRSINLLQKAENIHPNCEKTHYYLGRIYFKIGRLKDARAHANKALSIQPNYPPSQKLLKEIKDARNWLKLGGKQVRRLVSQIAKRIGF